jgi:hypothetical protein
VEVTPSNSNPVVRHRKEVMGVALTTLGSLHSPVVVGSIDSTGRAAVSLCPQRGARSSSDEIPAKRQRTTVQPHQSWWLEPERDPCGGGAAGWAGLAFSPCSSSSMDDLGVATAHFWSKRLSFYPSAAGGAAKPLRTSYAFHHPTDLCYIGNHAETPLVAVSVRPCTTHCIIIWFGPIR